MYRYLLLSFSSVLLLGAVKVGCGFELMVCRVMLVAPVCQKIPRLRVTRMCMCTYMYTYVRIARILQQDRQCTYNVTLRCVRESLLPWKDNEYYLLVCVCVRACGYPDLWACAYVHVTCLSSMQRICAICDVICGP